MPEITTIDASTALEELEAISKEFRTAHEALSTAFEKLENGMAGDEAEAGDGAALDGALADLDETLNAAEASIGTDLFKALDQLSTLAEDIESELAELQVRWNDLEEQTAATTSVLSTSIKSSYAKIQSLLATAETSMATIATDIDGGVTTFRGNIEGWSVRLGGEISDDLHTASETFTNTASGELSGSAQATLGEIKASLVELTLSLGSTAQTTGTSYRTDAETALKKLAADVQSDMKQQLTDAAESLVQDAVRELVKTALKLVIRSEIGMTTTAAMSPYLPQMAALNAGLDALREAIRAWKDLLDRFS